MKLGTKRSELEQLMQKFVPRSHVGFFLQRTDPIHPIGPKTNVSVRFVIFGKCMKVGAKHTELVQLIQKFVPRSHVVIFFNEHT